MHTPCKHHARAMHTPCHARSMHAPGPDEGAYLHEHGLDVAVLGLPLDEHLHAQRWCVVRGEW